VDTINTWPTLGASKNMRIISPSFEIINASIYLQKTIEIAGRVCYKSEDKICDGSDAKFIEHLKGLHHDSVIEHGSITVKIVCDRGVSHELVRHRLASYSQESTRYCNYSKDKFGGEITVIDLATGFAYDLSKPTDYRKYHIWRKAMANAEQSYFQMLDAGATAQEARSVLPNSLGTVVVITANPREWRHIFKMRVAQSAHPQMREIMLPMLEEFKSKWPAIFGDL
jgi:thymidylate synthase (FAD)